MSSRIVIPLNVGIVMAAESSFERDAAEKCSMGMSKSVAVFVTQGIPQRGSRGTHNPLKHLSNRKGRNVDISACAIPAPTKSESAPTQVDINVGQLLIIKAMGLQLSLHIGDSSIQAFEGDDLHAL